MRLTNQRTSLSSSPCSSKNVKFIKKELQNDNDQEHNNSLNNEEHKAPPQFDTSDLGSPEKVWSLLCEKEKEEKYRRDPLLFQHQRKINARMRSMLLDWLMDVCADKHLHRETFHLCVDYIDRYINMIGAEQVLPQRLQLIGSTALVIAAKIEEIYPPKIIEIAEYTDGCCTDQDIRNMEEIMLQQLDWNCYPITAVHWLALYMQLMNTNETIYDVDGHIFPDQRCTVPKLMRGEFVRMAKILDLVIMDAVSLHYRYRELATAVLLCYYEPENLICEITDSVSAKLHEVREFVEPFVQMFEKLEPAGTEIPCIPSVPHGDRHNIQTYISQCLTHLEAIEQTRKESEMRLKALNLLVTTTKTTKTRKRKFGSTLNQIHIAQNQQQL